MVRLILNTMLFAVILFGILVMVKYYTGVEEWLKETLMWVIPSTTGFFIGYWMANK